MGWRGVTALARRPRPLRCGVALRARVWFAAGALDRQLAAGTYPWRSPALAVRASQLTDHDQRQRLAAGLIWIVREARIGRRDAKLTVPLQRAAILSGADDLLALAAAVRSRSPCSPRAVALVSYLIHDGRSPLYDDHACASPAGLARAARAGFPAWAQASRPIPGGTDR
jgi:hypothetical protein